MECVRSSAQRVGFFNIGSGRVLDKIPGSESGSGWVGVSKYTIGYFRVSFFTLGYFRVCRVFSGTSGYVGYLRIFTGIYGYIGYHLFFGGSEQNIKV